MVPVIDSCQIKCCTQVNLFSICVDTLYVWSVLLKAYTIICESYTTWLVFFLFVFSKFSPFSPFFHLIMMSSWLCICCKQKSASKLKKRKEKKRQNIKSVQICFKWYPLPPFQIRHTRKTSINIEGPFKGHMLACTCQRKLKRACTDCPGKYLNTLSSIDVTGIACAAVCCTQEKWCQFLHRMNCLEWKKQCTQCEKKRVYGNDILHPENDHLPLKVAFRISASYTGECCRLFSEGQPQDWVLTWRTLKITP